MADLSPNLIINGTFEEGGSGNPWIPTNWTNYNLVAGDSIEDTTDYSQGSTSFRMDVGFKKGLTYNPITLTGAKRYRLGVYLKKPDGCSILVRIYNPTYGYTVNTEIGDGYTSWAEWSLAFYSPGTAANYWFRFATNTAVGGPWTVRVDRVTLRLASVPWDPISVGSEVWDSVASITASAWCKHGCRSTGFGHGEFGWQGGVNNRPWVDDGFGHGLHCQTWSSEWEETSTGDAIWDPKSIITTTWDNV